MVKRAKKTLANAPIITLSNDGTEYVDHLDKEGEDPAVVEEQTKLYKKSLEVHHDPLKGTEENEDHFQEVMLRFCEYVRPEYEEALAAETRRQMGDSEEEMQARTWIAADEFGAHADFRTVSDSYSYERQELLKKLGIPGHPAPAFKRWRERKQVEERKKDWTEQHFNLEDVLKAEYDTYESEEEAVIKALAIKYQRIGEEKANTLGSPIPEVDQEEGGEGQNEPPGMDLLDYGSLPPVGSAYGEGMWDLRNMEFPRRPEAFTECVARGDRIIPIPGATGVLAHVREREAMRALQRSSALREAAKLKIQSTPMHPFHQRIRGEAVDASHRFIDAYLQATGVTMNLGLLRANINVGNDRLDKAVAEVLSHSSMDGNQSSTGVTRFSGEVGQILKKIQSFKQQTSGSLSLAQIKTLGELGKDSAQLLKDAQSTMNLMAKSGEKDLIDDLSNQLSTAMTQITDLVKSNESAIANINNLNDNLGAAQKETASLKSESKKLVEDMKISVKFLQTGDVSNTVRDNVVRMSNRLKEVEAGLNKSLSNERALKNALDTANARLSSDKRVNATISTPAPQAKTRYFGGRRAAPASTASTDITSEQAVKDRIKLLGNNTTESLYQGEPAIDEIKKWYLSQPGKVEIPGYDLYWNITWSTFAIDRSWSNPNNWSYEKNRVVAASEKAAAAAAAAAARAPADAALKAAQIKAASEVEQARREAEASRAQAQREADESLLAAERAAANQAAADAQASRDQDTPRRANPNEAPVRGQGEPPPGSNISEEFDDDESKDDPPEAEFKNGSDDDDIVTDLATRMEMRLQSWKDPSRVQLAHTYGRYIYVNGQSLVDNVKLDTVIGKEYNIALFEELSDEGTMHVQTPSGMVDITMWDKSNNAPVHDISKILDAAEKQSGVTSTNIAMTYFLLYLIHRIGIKDDNGTVIVEPDQTLIGKPGASYESSPFSSMFLWM